MYYRNQLEAWRRERGRLGERYTVEEIAQVTGVSKATIRRHMMDGKMKWEPVATKGAIRDWMNQPAVARLIAERQTDRVLEKYEKLGGGE